MFNWRTERVEEGYSKCVPYCHESWTQPGSRVRIIRVRIRRPVIDRHRFPLASDKASGARKKPSANVLPLFGHKREVGWKRRQLIAHDAPKFVNSDGTAFQDHGTQDHGLTLGRNQDIGEVLDSDHNPDVRELLAAHASSVQS